MLDRLTSVRRRIAQLLFRRRLEADLEEEIRTHIQMATEEYLRQGMTPEEATKAARRDFGGVDQVKERHREGRRGAWIASLARELESSARALSRRPGFALAVIGTLGLGIGATTTVYGVVDGILLRDLPYDSPSTLVTVGSLSPSDGSSASDSGLQRISPISWSNLRTLGERSRSLDAVGGLVPNRVVVTPEGEVPESVATAAVTPGLLEILGVSPQVGRGFASHEFDAGSDRVVLITHGYWERRYGADPDVVGRPLERAAAEGAFLGSTVIGVLPPDFTPPEAFFPTAEAPDIYAPYDATGEDPRVYNLSVLHALGRLHPGVALESARAEVAAIAADLADEFPERNVSPDGHPLGIGVNGLLDQTVGASGRALWIFLGAAGLLLVISAMNAATILLARSLERRTELGVRAALGAGSAGLVRLLVSEAVLLSLLGAALGVVLSFAGVAAFLRFAPPSLPRLDAVAVDLRVVAVAVIGSIAIGVAAGLLPAIRVTADGLATRLRRGGRGITDTGGRLRPALVGGQIGLAVMLLSAAGLLFGSFLRVQATDPGFEPDGLIAMTTENLMRSRVSRQAVWTLWEPTLEEVRAVPGVESAAGATGLPFQPPTWSVRLLLPGDAPDVLRDEVNGYGVTAGYFETMGIRLIQGRGVRASDAADGEAVVVVNEAFVRSLLGGADPLNLSVRRVQGNGSSPGDILPMRIVGVAEDVVQARPDDGPRPAIYLPHSQAVGAGAPSTMWAVVRTSRPPDAILADLRAGLFESGRLSRDLGTMWSRISAAHVSPRFQSLLITSFALVALLLAAAGLYGSQAYAVSRRRRDLGLRMALGASRSAVMRVVLVEGMRVVAFGLLGGLAGTLLVGRVLSGMLYEIQPHDPVTVLSAAGLLAGVALAACFLPALRAIAVDPVTVLGSE